MTIKYQAPCVLSECHYQGVRYLRLRDYQGVTLWLRDEGGSMQFVEREEARVLNHQYNVAPKPGPREYSDRNAG